MSYPTEFGHHRLLHPIDQFEHGSTFNDSLILLLQLVKEECRNIERTDGISDRRTSSISGSAIFARVVARATAMAWSFWYRSTSTAWSTWRSKRALAICTLNDSLIGWSAFVDSSNVPLLRFGDIYAPIELRREDTELDRLLSTALDLRFRLSADWFKENAAGAELL